MIVCKVCNPHSPRTWWEAKVHVTYLFVTLCVWQRNVDWMNLLFISLEGSTWRLSIRAWCPSTCWYSMYFISNCGVCRIGNHDLVFTLSQEQYHYKNKLPNLKVRSMYKNQIIHPHYEKLNLITVFGSLHL